MTDRPIRVILDASAITRFVRGGEKAIAVGEIVSEIDDEGCSVGLPMQCIFVAAAVVGEDHWDMLKLLWKHRASQLLRSPEDVFAVVRTTEIVGRMDAAIAALLAIDLDVCLLSTTPALYAGLGDPDLVIEV